MGGIDALTAAIGDLAREDPQSLADGDSIEALHRELARLDALVTRATAAFDASGEWTADGARDAAAWVATRCRLPRAEARRRVRLGRRLRHLPAFAEAWAAGAVTEAHVRVVSPLCRPPLDEVLRCDETLLLEHATTLRFEWFQKAVAYWEQCADPDGAEQVDADRRDARAVFFDQSFQGMWLGRFTLDPVGGTIFGGELRRLEQELFETDWAEAKARLGREPTVDELGRTPAQRRADALVEMAGLSRTMPRGGQRPLPLFSVLVDYETLHGRVCELADGTVIAPGSLVPWLPAACVERAVFGPDRRVEIGATARLFGGATRRAIMLRDRVCTHPYCDRPAEQCEVDHVLPFSAGGATTQENGRLLCGFHNRLRNQRPPPAA